MSTSKKIFFGYADPANGITIIGLILSLTSCFFALNGDLQTSLIFLIVSGICDLFDGFAARKIKRTDAEKEFGIQLDTVVDVVSFGVTPSVIMYSMAGTAWYTLAACVFYIVCSVTRLAYFNTTAVPDKTAFCYSGLPVTYIALILPVVLLFNSAFAGVITLVIVGVLFVLNIRIPKPQGVWYILFPIMAIVLAVLWWLL